MELRSSPRSSSTTTETETETKQDEILILNLRQRDSRRVSWDNEVINNESLGKKTSKRCCIYHKKRTYNESDSDESDSDVENAEKSDPKPGAPPLYQRFHA